MGGRSVLGGRRSHQGPDLPAVSWISRWCRKTDLLNSKSRRKATCKLEVTGAGRLGTACAGIAG